MKKKTTLVAAILVIALVSSVIYAKIGKDKPKESSVQNEVLKITHQLGEASISKNPKFVTALLLI